MPSAAQRRRDALDLVQQLRVGEEAALAALVEVDQRRVAAPSARDVTIERVVREVRLAADEPAERRAGPLEHAVPRPEPRQLARGAFPERVRIGARVFNPLLHDWCHDGQGNLRSRWMIRWRSVDQKPGPVAGEGHGTWPENGG